LVDTPQPAVSRRKIALFDQLFDQQLGTETGVEGISRSTRRGAGLGGCGASSEPNRLRGARL